MTTQLKAKKKLACNNKDTDKNTKKKKTRFFETYISKVLKQVNDASGITSNAKQQLNSTLCVLSQKISSVVLNLTIIAKKKTLSEKEVQNAVKILFTGELSLNAVIEGEKSIKKYKEKNTKGSSRQGKAGIIFPPSIAEKFLRNFGFSKIMVTSTAPIFFAAVLEYFTEELLTLASESAISSKRIRITIRDLEMSVQNDDELLHLFNGLNISFVGGGVVPYIHESLSMKKPRKKRKINSIPGVKKNHRFRPGTVSLREIKKFQKTAIVLPLLNFHLKRLFVV